MSTVSFYLKTPSKRTNSKVNEGLIYLQFRRNLQKFTYTFGQTISPGKWSKTKQRAKLNSEPCVGRKEGLNDLLNSLEKVVEKSLKNGITGKIELKNILDSYLDKDTIKTGTENALYNLVDRFLSNEIKVNGKDKKPATIRSYKTTVRHLKEYQAIKRVELNLETINQDFYYQYITFLRTRSKYEQPLQLLWKDDKRKAAIINLGDNAIGKDIKNIRTFMNEALDQDITTNNGFNKKKIKVFNEPGEAVYLNDKEILKLSRFDLTGNKRLESVRDLFVFSCCVGLRYSDLTNIKPENIILDNEQKFIRLITQKTGGEVIIPTGLQLVQDIFNKYRHNANNLPAFISNVKYNKYIKEACKLAGFTEKNRMPSQPAMELWEAISSHTGRRSFATNLYLQGAPKIDIMRVTGHKTESSFFRYIKVDKVEAAKRINEHYKTNASQNSLAVAS